MLNITQKTLKSKPYTKGYYKGMDSKSIELRGNGLMLHVTQTIGTEEFAIVYASTSVIENKTESQALVIAKSIIEDGITNIIKMRELAKSFDCYCEHYA